MRAAFRRPAKVKAFIRSRPALVSTRRPSFGSCGRGAGPGGSSHAFALPHFRTIFRAMLGFGLVPGRCGSWLRAIAAGGALGAAFLLPQGQAATSPGQLALSYQVLLGPLPVMTVTADLALPGASAQGPYRADIVGRAGGYVGQIYDWSFTARSE